MENERRFEAERNDATFAAGNVRTDGRGREALQVHQVPPFPVEVLQMRFLPRVAGFFGCALLSHRRLCFRGARGHPRERGRQIFPSPFLPFFLLSTYFYVSSVFFISTQ